MMKFLRFLTAAAVCGLALLLPFRARVIYGKALGWLLQAPNMLFAYLARHLIKSLGIKNLRELTDNAGRGRR